MRLYSFALQAGEELSPLSLSPRFDVKAYGCPLPHQEDTGGMMAALKALDELVQDEVNLGIPEESIVVGGFSQGSLRSIPSVELQT